LNEIALGNKPSAEVQQAATIEERRAAELEPINLARAESERTGEAPVVNGELVSKKTIDDINAKYDAEQASVSEAPQTLPEVTNEIAQLREQEQAENEAIDPNDEVAKKEIYDKYDEVITPLLEKEKELKAEETQAPVAEEVKPQEKGEFSIQGTFDGMKQVLGNPANKIPDIVRADIEPKFSESNQNGKKVFTLTVPQLDDAGRAGYLAVSLVFPETTTKTIDDVKSALENKMTEAQAAVELSREKGFPLETVFKNKVGSEYVEQVTPTSEPQAPVAEEAKGEEAPTSEQTPQAFPAQEGSESVQDKFQANAELEQIYRDLNAAVTKKLDPKTLEDVKRNPTLVMVEKALRELERKGVIKIDCN
jgi:hypothetical protein